MTEKKENDTKPFKTVAVIAISIAATITAVGTIGSATKKAAVYLNLPDRMDRFEEVQNKQGVDVAKILEILEK